MSLNTPEKSIKDSVSPEEWQTRVNLAACYRLIAK
ncbi:MAG: class II aldolase, partial [Pseudomonadales bacterium]|nr:class II aldolase [Pseudomonadales bacterium]